jgi:zinc transport system substrate-binding protein
MRHARRAWWALGALLGGLLAAGATRAADDAAAAADNNNAPRLCVCVALPPQRWLTQKLAGERVVINLLLQPGQNPHTFEPTARQVAELTRADLFFTLGLPFERTIAAKARAVRPRLTVCDMAAGVPRRALGAAEGHQHDGAAPGARDDDDDCRAGGDPHVWLAPSAMLQMASNTVAALAARDPDGRAFYAARLARLTAEITALDQELRAALAPARGGLLLSYHPSWGYFADAYGLRQAAIEAEGRPPSARQLARLIETALGANVRLVLTEPAYDPKPARTVAQQIGAELVVADPLAEAWDANLRALAARLGAAATPPAMPAPPATRRSP